MFSICVCFLFKQKTAYELRISDWSSDVCSSELDNPPPIDPIKNVVRIDQANTIYWNGTAVDPATLKSYLRQTTQMDPEPERHLEPDPNARYALVDQVLAVAKQSQVTKMGFVVNERYYPD